MVDDLEIMIDRDARTIVIPKAEYSMSRHRMITEPFTIHVPRLFGTIRDIERRGDYLVVRAEYGKTAYYLTRGHHNLGAPNRIGWMTWHNVRKAIRELCLLPPLAARVDMRVTYYQNTPGHCASWAHGRVLVNDSIVLQGNELAFELGRALEAYLRMDPGSHLTSGNGIIRSFALLDRRTTDEELASCSPDDCAHPLWAPFLRIRSKRSWAVDHPDG